MIRCELIVKAHRSTSARTSPSSSILRRSVPSLLLLVLACGSDDPIGPGGPLTILPAEVTFDALRVSAGITASVGDRTTTRPDLRIEVESRWLHDVPVLDADSLAVARLHTLGPGSVELTVTAFGGSGTLAVHVEPAGPVVMQILGSEWLQSSEEIVLRGYLLNGDLGEITFAGTPAAMLDSDSASVRLTFPELPESGACGTSTDTIRVPGAAVITSLARQRAHGTPLTLEVGEFRAMTGEELSCFVLPAGTRYALAYFDPSLVERARTQPERGGEIGWVEFTLTRAGHDDPASAPSPVSPTHHSDILMHGSTSAAANDHPPPHLRAHPWTLGEVFPVEAVPGHGLQARVHRIYDERYVLAIEDDLGTDTVSAFLRVFDSFMPAFISETVAFFQAIFSEREAVTSTASDQLLILVGRFCFPGFAVEREDVNAARSVGWVVLGVCYINYSNPPVDDFEHLFSHEMAHIWSFIYAHDQLGQRGLGGSIWGLEGVATLMAQEVVRRRLNIGLLSNYDARGQKHHYAFSVLHQGKLHSGYRNSASFLRDLVARRLQAGNESYESALREVARGAVDGWYGYAECCDGWWSDPAHRPLAAHSSVVGAPADVRLPGLVARMKSVNPAWEPEHAVLLWTLAHALDDRTTSPELQVASFRDAVGAAAWMSDGAYSWEPDAESTSASGPLYVFRDGANSGYSYLHNDDEIGYYGIEQDPLTPRLRWLIARYQ